MGGRVVSPRTAQLARERSPGSGAFVEVLSQLMWPTPRANKVGGYSSEGYRPTLEQAVMTWPTPVTGDCRGAGPNQNVSSLGREVKRRHGGHLNPEWVEALMGFPPGFTRLDD